MLRLVGGPTQARSGSGAKLLRIWSRQLAVRCWMRFEDEDEDDEEGVMVPVLTVGDFCEQWRMLKLLTALFVFLGGFSVMVLEIIGTPFLASEFGGAFYIWVSQIGVILVALALGYAIGGTLADRFKRVDLLTVPLAIVGLYTMFIPGLTKSLLEKIVMRHPVDAPIPMVWVKLDPVLGSALVFFLPCCVLAVISPYMVRFAARRLEQVGTVSGLIYSASTVGSIAGVFVSGYYLMDNFSVPAIFRFTGGLMLVLAVLSVVLERAMKRNITEFSSNRTGESVKPG